MPSKRIISLSTQSGKVSGGHEIKVFDFVQRKIKCFFFKFVFCFISSSELFLFFFFQVCSSLHCLFVFFALFLSFFFLVSGTVKLNVVCAALFSEELPRTYTHLYHLLFCFIYLRWRCLYCCSYLLTSARAAEQIGRQAVAQGKLHAAFSSFRVVGSGKALISVFFFFEFLLLLLLPFRLFFHSARRDIRAHFLLSQVTLFAFGLHFGSVFFFFFFFTGGTFYCPSCAFGSSSFFFFLPSLPLQR